MPVKRRSTIWTQKQIVRNLHVCEWYHIDDPYKLIMSYVLKIFPPFDLRLFKYPKELYKVKNSKTNLHTILFCLPSRMIEWWLNEVSHKHIIKMTNLNHNIEPVMSRLVYLVPSLLLQAFRKRLINKALNSQYWSKVKI